ncbi:MAG: hypothetical protein IRY90_08655 [Actinomadura rubrobrunea]|nr:hypothetical protein [Actinomadura rubrobrunea]
MNVHVGRGTAVDNAVRRLAASVSERVMEETGRRSVWQTEQPIVLHVASTKRPVQARGPARLKLEGDSTGIADLFRALPSPQLTIIGAPGAGKTVLALLLTRDLLPELGSEPPQNPIPVFLSLASWHPDVPLKTWMAARIQEDHPGIADTPAEARELVLKMMEEQRIIPVLDGLDEVTAAAPADAIAGIGAAFDDRAPFVVTCRDEEYADAVRASGSPLARAAGVEIDDGGVEDAIAYLGGAGIDDTRWRPVFERLRADPEGALAESLSTPLMLSLARIAYQRPTTDPADLLEYTVKEDVEEHLLDTFVPATYARHLGPRYAEHQVRRWLGTLACGPLEYRWWHFRSHVPDLVAALVFALGVGWMLRLMMDTTWAIVGAIAVLIVVEAVTQIILLRNTEIVVSEHGTADARAHLRTYRRLALLCAAGTAIVIAAALGAWLGAGLGADTAAVATYAGTYGCAFGLAVLISTAWGRYTVSRCLLALRGLLPS